MARQKKRTILIDADVYCYQAAAAIEEATDWGDGYWTWHCDANAVEARVLDMIEKTVENLDGTDYKICLTDGANWRLDVLPTYKGNRAATKRPLVLKHIKQWLVDEHDAMIRPTLEGDDLLGILATWPGIKGEKIIVSLDKDMKTIPGLYCRNALTPGFPKLQLITPEEAQKYHLKQTLSGDTTDGYKGCPGIGLETAEKIIEGGLLKVPFEHTVLRGARKGEVETRYTEEPCDDLWAVVVSHYEAAGLTEEDALVQARVARICHAEDYDMDKQEVILWTPN